MDIIEKQICCKSCFHYFRPSLYRILLEKKPILCDECISKIIKKLEYKKIRGIKTLFLSSYNGIMKQWLMNYKEYKDIELAPCFLASFLPVVQLYSLNSIFVPCPSAEKRIQERGFSHLNEILSSYSLSYLDLLSKEDTSEQKEKTNLERRKEQGIYVKNDAILPKNKSIILFDDIYTTGETLYQSYLALRKVFHGQIKGLILMHNDATEKLILK